MNAKNNIKSFLASRYHDPRGCIDEMGVSAVFRRHDNSETLSLIFGGRYGGLNFRVFIDREGQLLHVWIRAGRSGFVFMKEVITVWKEEMTKDLRHLPVAGERLIESPENRYPGLIRNYYDAVIGIDDPGFLIKVVDFWDQLNSLAEART